mmetsp:Transcript_82435/g.229737  ORF Transcript_82435/g.229737 Transcript_82435/m.229737 type:complete len:249 (+) Transcript_82435:1321-2067(+)
MEHVGQSPLHVARREPPHWAGHVQQGGPCLPRHELFKAHEAHSCRSDGNFAKEPPNCILLVGIFRDEVLDEVFPARSEVVPGVVHADLVIDVRRVFNARPLHPESALASGGEIHKSGELRGLPDVVHARIKLEALVFECVCAPPSNVVLLKHHHTPPQLRQQRRQIKAGQAAANDDVVNFGRYLPARVTHTEWVGVCWELQSPALVLAAFRPPTEPPQLRQRHDGSDGACDAKNHGAARRPWCARHRN